MKAVEIELGQDIGRDAEMSISSLHMWPRMGSGI
jgi:hypothetical protein